MPELNTCFDLQRGKKLPKDGYDKRLPSNPIGYQHYLQNHHSISCTVMKGAKKT